MTLKFTGYKVLTLGIVVTKFQVFTMKETQVTHFAMIEGKFAQKSHELNSNVGFEIIKILCTSIFLCYERLMGMIDIIF